MALPILNPTTVPVLTSITGAKDIVDSIVGIVKSNNDTKVQLKKIDTFFKLNEKSIDGYLEKDLGAMDALKEAHIELLKIKDIPAEIKSDLTKVFYDSIISVTNKPLVGRNNE